MQVFDALRPQEKDVFRHLLEPRGLVEGGPPLFAADEVGRQWRLLLALLVRPDRIVVDVIGLAVLLACGHGYADNQSTRG